MSTEKNITDGGWRQSRFCASASCVQVRRIDGGYEVRSTNDPERVVWFTAGEWAAFLRGVDEGEFADV